MYNVDKLERQWIRYRRKKIILPVLVAILGIAIIAVSTYLIGIGAHSSDGNVSIVLPKKKVLVPIAHSEPQAKTSMRKSLVEPNTLSTKVPSLSAVQNEEHTKIGKIIFQDSSIEVNRRTPKRKKLLIKVTERGRKDIARDIENRFKFAKDKSDSLFLAKYYYGKGIYGKSEKWALETNRLDNTIEESWLIFAKSLAKQGKRIEALKVLKAFLNLDNSMKAKRLMDKIRRGKRF